MGYIPFFSVLFDNSIALSYANPYSYCSRLLNLTLFPLHLIRVFGLTTYKNTMENKSVKS